VYIRIGLTFFAGKDGQECFRFESCAALMKRRGSFFFFDEVSPTMKISPRNVP